MSSMQEKTTLSGVITTAKGKPPVTIPYYGEGAEPYLSPEFLRGNAPSAMAKAGANAVRVEDGDTILLWDGSNAGEFFRARKGILASTMARLIHSDGFDQGYFFYAVKRWESYLKGQTSGSGIPHVDKEVLGNLSILRLEKPEQAKIAAIFSTIDRAIEQTEAIIAKQQRIKTGLMQDLLTRGIDKHGNIRSEATHQFKDSPLGRIPVEWEVAQISEFGAKNRPFLRTGPFGSDLNTRHWTKQGIPVITIGSLGEGEIIEHELLFVNERTAEALKGFRVQPGDIVFSRVADIGRSLVIREHQSGWIISSNLMRISLDKSIARPMFLYRNISFNANVHAQLRNSSNSGGRDLVNGPILRGLLFPWAKLEEQDRINEMLESVEIPIIKMKEQHKKLQQTKTGLMQDLLTGRVRVTGLLEKP